MLRSADLRADVGILRRAYTALHPGLLRYNTPAQIDSAFTALDGFFRQDRSLGDAYLAFSVLAARIKCGHTYANFYNQSEAIAGALLNTPGVPFYFRWLDRRMIVTRSFTPDTRLRPGAEVLSLNGVPVSRILDTLMTVARADGNNDAKRVAWLQIEGNDRYEAFDVFWPLFFPAPASEVTLRLRAEPGGPVETLTVPRLRAEARQPSQATSVTGSNEPAWEYRPQEERVGYLRMTTWALYNSQWNWRVFLREMFARLAADSATDLVIDLRGNEGGVDVGEVIISHLIAAPIERQGVVRMVRYRRVPEDLVPYLDTWDPTFKDWGPAAIDSTERFFRIRRGPDDDPGGTIAPVGPRFAGRVWVLVGATNSSATFEFARQVRQHRLGTLVGQPTGGNLRGINGGAFFFLRLPRTGLELDLPLIGQFPVADQPDAGVVPDLLVSPTAEDIARGRDVELEAVLARIRRR